MTETAFERSANTRRETRHARWTASAGGGCLIAAVALLLAGAVSLIVVGSALGRVGSWLSFDPLGVFAEPETTIDTQRAAVVVQMQSLARLETQHFTVEKIIEAEKDGNALQDLLHGDRILLIAHGDVIAGVDLAQLDERDVRVDDDGRVRVELPPSEVFIATLDNEKTRVYDRERGLLSRGDAELETKARQAAERAIHEAACEEGILERAADEAATQVEALLRLLDFTNVTVVAPAGTCAIPAPQE